MSLNEGGKIFDYFKLPSGRTVYNQRNYNPNGYKLEAFKEVNLRTLVFGEFVATVALSK